MRWDLRRRVERNDTEKGREAERSVQPQFYPSPSLPPSFLPLLYLPFPVHIALSAEKGPAAAASMFSEIMRTEEKADYGEQSTLSAFYELERIKVTSQSATTTAPHYS